MFKDSKKIAPKAFEYRLNLHKKTSDFLGLQVNCLNLYFLYKSLAQRVLGETSMLDTNSDASSISLQNLHVPR